jgi:hypothetical protein
VKKGTKLINEQQLAFFIVAESKPRVSGAQVKPIGHR